MNLINRTIKSPITYLATAVLLMLCWLGSRYVDIVSLPAIDMDAYAFIGIYVKLWNGFIHHSIRDIMAYCFYSYGWVYFFINTLLVAPFILLGKWSMVIFIPRFMSILPAVATLVVLYRIWRMSLDKISSALLAVLLLSMPYFWETALQTHPDWLMICFLALGLYSLLRDNLEGKKGYWFFILYFGIAFGLKFQTLTFFPLIGVCFFFQDHSLKERLKKFAISLLSIGGIYLLLNPHLIHPRGRGAFWASLNDNLASNATNHFTGIHVSYVEKLQLILKGYYSLPLLIIILAAIFWLFLVLFINKNRSVVERSTQVLYVILAGTMLVNIAYLFIKVNKLWIHYYIGCLVFGFLLLGFALRGIAEQKRRLFILILCILQILIFFPNYLTILKADPQLQHIEVATRSASDFILKNIQCTAETRILISAGLGMDFQKVDVNFNQITVLYGSVTKGYFDFDAYRSDNPQKTKEQAEADFIRYDYIILKQDKTNPATKSTIHEYDTYGYSIVSQNNSVVILKKRN